MEDVLFSFICSAMRHVPDRRRNVEYDTHEILRIGLWAILKDRPQSWACEPGNWSDAFRPEQLPDQSTLSRRWNSPELRDALQRLGQILLAMFGPLNRDAAVDGRPLLVGGASKDPDATAGRAVGGFGRGYRMHAIVTRDGVVAALQVRPLNESEKTAARELIPRPPSEVQRITGDGNYDSMRLHDTAAACGRRLYAPIREDRVGRRQQPRRLRLLKLFKTAPGQALLKGRDHVERCFGRMSNLAFGLKGLPAWVRRLRRVRTWVEGKIVFHHAYLLIKDRQLGKIRA